MHGTLQLKPEVQTRTLCVRATFTKVAKISISFTELWCLERCKSSFLYHACNHYYTMQNRFTAAFIIVHKDIAISIT